jgi:hypothetical protein
VTALRSQKTIGLTLAIFGALLLTPDTLFMRLSQLDGLNMLLWRGGLSGLAYFMIWLWMRSPRDLSNIWTGNFAIIVACQIGNAAFFSLAIAIAPVTVALIGVAYRANLRRDFVTLDFGRSPLKPHAYHLSLSRFRPIYLCAGR